MAPSFLLCVIIDTGVTYFSLQLTLTAKGQKAVCNIPSPKLISLSPPPPPQDSYSNTSLYFSKIKSEFPSK